MFRDTLGNHELATSLQLTSRFEEIGGAAMYINRTHRWNWGLLAEQTPYILGSFSEFLSVRDNQPVVAQQELQRGKHVRLVVRGENARRRNHSSRNASVG